LNVGECHIEGANQRLIELRQQGCEIRILTNVACYERARVLKKFKRLGVKNEASEFITSRDAAISALSKKTGA